MIHEAAPITITETSRGTASASWRGGTAGAELTEAPTFAGKRRTEKGPGPTQTQQRPPLVCFKGQRSALHFTCNVTQSAGQHGVGCTTSRALWWLLMVDMLG